MKRQTPNYEYSNGLTMDVISCVDGELQAKQVVVPEGQVRRPLPRDRMTEVEEALSNPGYVTLRDGETAVRGQCAVIEPPQSIEPNGQVEIIWPQWSVPLDGEVNVDYMLGQIAVDPATRYVCVQLPGIDGADVLPRAMRKTLRETGRFAIAGGLYANLPGTDADIKIRKGASTGGRLAIASGAADDEPNYVITADVPGSQELGLLGLGKAFMIDELRHSNAYVAAAKQFDPETVARQKQYDNMLRFMGRAMGNHPLFQFVTMPWAMSRDGLLADVESCLANPANRGVVIQSPTMSELSDSERMLSWVGPDHAGLSVVRFNGTHSYGQAHSIAAAMANAVAKQTFSL